MGVLLAACTPPAPAAPREPPPEPLRTTPLTSIVTGVGLSWMLDIDLPRVRTASWFQALFDQATEHTELHAMQHRFGAEAAAMDEIVYASFGTGELYLEHGAFSRAIAERGFGDHGAPPEGRAEDRAKAGSGRHFETVTRVWGTVRGGREELAMMGQNTLALARGSFEPLTAAELFAEGRLKRARPTLMEAPLAATLPVLGDAAVRAFVPGPFEGESASRLGGLLRAATAVGMAISPGAESPRVRLRLLVTGAWGGKGHEAAMRLGAAFDTWSHDFLGRAAGLDHPLAGPNVSESGDTLVLDAEFDGDRVSKALHQVTSATTADLFGRTPESAR